MSLELHALCFDANEPRRLAEFWGELLLREVAEDPRDGVVLLPNDPAQFPIRFPATVVGKEHPNQVHFDLTSESAEDQAATVARALELGASHLDVGQRPEEGHVVLADPEGNEFCVIEAGNNFLAGCGRLGALSGDGTQAVGYFWHHALGWPLVWDQDEETAIQAPAGGAKFTWGGPPVDPQHGKNRLHFDLVPSLGVSHEAEVERLLGLGATHVDIGQGDVAWSVLADPDGNEFCLRRRS